jgi:hypothetical protein
MVVGLGYEKKHFALGLLIGITIGALIVWVAVFVPRFLQSQWRTANIFRDQETVATLRLGDGFEEDYGFRIVEWTDNNSTAYLFRVFGQGAQVDLPAAVGSQYRALGLDIHVTENTSSYIVIIFRRY